MKTCEIKDTFGIDALKFSERPDPPLQQGQVRIRVRAVSLNYRDLVTVKHD
jgi:NADPH:quinone reductase-like Zn-dependent oxidoreductase